MHEHITHTWNFMYIALSYVIAVLASFFALQLATRAGQRNDTARHFHLYTQGFLLGFGIWAMHFIGMLAWQPDARHGFDPLPTLGSGLAAVVFLTAAVFVVNAGRATFARLLAGGTVAGTGIVVMHYSGMAAVEIAAVASYAAVPFVLSVLIAVSAATVALLLFSRVSSPWAERQTAPVILSLKIAAALVMGVAIIGMHYTGMAAIRYTADSSLPQLGLGSDGSFLAQLVITATIVVFAFAVLMLALDKDADGVTAIGD